MSAVAHVDRLFVEWTISERVCGSCASPCSDACLPSFRRGFSMHNIHFPAHEPRRTLCCRLCTNPQVKLAHIPPEAFPASSVLTKADQTSTHRPCLPDRLSSEEPFARFSPIWRIIRRWRRLAKVRFIPGSCSDIAYFR